MYCSVCGKEIMDEAVICPGCGCMVNRGTTTPSKNQMQKETSVSLILGIIGIVFAWLFALVGHVVSIIGIVFGIKEYKKSEKTTGLVLSIIGEVCSIFSSIMGVVIFHVLFK